MYSATVSFKEADNVIKNYTYFGQTSTQFVVRYRNHKQSFKNEKLEKATELSKFIWDLKRKGLEHSIKWNIVRKAQPYKPGSKFCNLCTSEAICIGYPAENLVLINTREEIISNCRHKSKWKLDVFTNF